MADVKQGAAPAANIVGGTAKAAVAKGPELPEEQLTTEPLEEEGSTEEVLSPVVNKPVQEAPTATRIPFKDKEVDIFATKDHACHIGGTDYAFKEGKSYKVLQSVATILSHARLAFKK